MRHIVAPYDCSQVISMTKGSRLLRDSTSTLLAEMVVGLAVLINGVVIARASGAEGKGNFALVVTAGQLGAAIVGLRWYRAVGRSEEHTSELQSHSDTV